ncbi:DUF1292 domain-containing protein [Paenibacillus kyungheensis]|uniref:DUF1292 domain-containing protein n=1 Tax=Paenibacillus kyungheensis TaxID=1452732 RepID=A0AAX3M3M2_9BACL|nr:DUF1292 domain-containing protein [Paenibacillus kyungheensis]WCT56452.1 DUF1292 domain-containing protein [Paenibacillus kyungheensis]
MSNHNNFPIELGQFRDDLGLLEDEAFQKGFLILDEQGNEHDMMIVKTFTYDQIPYALLLHKEPSPLDGTILRVEYDEGEDEFFLNHITDDEEWQRMGQVYEVIIQLNKDNPPASSNVE